MKVDDGPWQPATLDRRRQGQVSWKLFTYTWKGATPGEHTIVSRVTDANGKVQPAAADNESKKSFLEDNSQMIRKVMVLVAMGLIEWRVLGTRGMPRAGLVQIGALFLGGAVISVSLLVGAQEAGGAIYLLTSLIAVVLFAVRVWPRSLRTDWVAANPSRHIAASSIWVVAAMSIFMYVVFVVISTGVDPTAPDGPGGVLVASDHAAYIGIVTNIMLGLTILLLLRAEVREGWIGQLVFWGVNLGLLVFAIGLIAKSSILKEIGAPVMGITLLFAIGVLVYAAFREPLQTTEADLEPVT